MTASSGRWTPSSYRARATGGPSVSAHAWAPPAGPPAPGGACLEIVDERPGVPGGCIWWLLLLGALALPAVVLAASLAAQAIGS